MRLLLVEDKDSFRRLLVQALDQRRRARGGRGGGAGLGGHRRGRPGRRPGGPGRGALRDPGHRPAPARHVRAGAAQGRQAPPPGPAGGAHVGLRRAQGHRGGHALGGRRLPAQAVRPGPVRTGAGAAAGPGPGAAAGSAGAAGSSIRRPCANWTWAWPGRRTRTFAVLFQGEAGAGKGRAARRLHVLRHPQAPYLCLSAPSLPPEGPDPRRLALLQGGSLTSRSWRSWPRQAAGRWPGPWTAERGGRSTGWAAAGPQGPARAAAPAPGGDLLRPAAAAGAAGGHPAHVPLPSWRPGRARTAGRCPMLERGAEKELLQGAWPGNLGQLAWAVASAWRATTRPVLAPLPAGMPGTGAPRPGAGPGAAGGGRYMGWTRAPGPGAPGPDTPDPGRVRGRRAGPRPPALLAARPCEGRAQAERPRRGGPGPGPARPGAGRGLADTPHLPGR